jgi:hypothetical protein
MQEIQAVLFAPSFLSLNLYQPHNSKKGRLDSEDIQLKMAM